MVRRATLTSSVLLGLFFAIPLPAWAHMGMGHSSGLGAGFLHPIGGLDHLLAMLAVGFWGAQLGGRAIWLVPLAFLSVMTAGFLLGTGGSPLPLVEQGILASVVVLGLLIAAAWKLPLAVSCLLVGVFSLCHGHAHGTEMPLDLSGLTYAVGFISSTLLLHVAGLGLGVLVRGSAGEMAGRLAGAAVMLAGLYLAIA
jgi:urease accessory protein